MLFERGTASLSDVREGEFFTLVAGTGCYERPDNSSPTESGKFVHLKRGTILSKGPQVEVVNAADGYRNHWFARCAVLKEVDSELPAEVVGYVNVANNTYVHFEALSKPVVEFSEFELEIAAYWNQLNLRSQAGLLGVHNLPSWNDTYVQKDWGELPEDEQARLRPQIERKLKETKSLEFLGSSERFSKLVQQAQRNFC